MPRVLPAAANVLRADAKAERAPNKRVAPSRSQSRKAKQMMNSSAAKNESQTSAALKSRL
jgi:hypothetical protein